MNPRMNDVELLYMHVWSFSSCTMSARPLSDSIVGLGEERPDSIDSTTVAKLVSCPNRDLLYAPKVPCSPVHSWMMIDIYK